MEMTSHPNTNLGSEPVLAFLRSVELFAISMNKNASGSGTQLMRDLRTVEKLANAHESADEEILNSLQAIPMSFGAEEKINDQVCAIAQAVVEIILTQ